MGYFIWIALCTIAGYLIGVQWFPEQELLAAAWGFAFGVVTSILASMGGSSGGSSSGFDFFDFDGSDGGD
jgi:uncharacterized membrane protein YdjX (TVP38/TMEM64 family)